MPRWLTLLLACVVLAGCTGPSTPPDDQDPGPEDGEAGDKDQVEEDPPTGTVGDVRLFARIPETPGFPEGIHLWNDTVFVGTIPFNQPDVAPVLYVLDRETGVQLEAIEVDVGERRNEQAGLAGMTVDGKGRLYVGEGGSGNVLRFVPDNGSWTQETYAVIPDLAPCGAAPCSPTEDDRAPLPNDLVFDANGTLYVTDSYQATIWRIPVGGEPEVWFQDERTDALFGPNCLRISPDESWMYFTVSGDLPVDTDRKLMRVSFPEPTTLETVRVFTTNDFPDGCTFGESGRLYIGLNVQNQVIAMEDGEEVGRWPSPAQNAASEVPVDFPASMVFDDAKRSLMLTNYAAFWSSFPVAHPQPERFAVLEMFVDDVAYGPERPVFD